MYLSLIILCVVLVAWLTNAKPFIKIWLQESKNKRVAFEFAQTHAVVGVDEIQKKIIVTGIAARRSR